MRYFIGNLVRGEAAEYYKATCAELASRFGIANVAEIVPPYMTVQPAFERPNAEAVDELLSLGTDAAPIPFALSGWNHFGNRTIFIDLPQPSAELTAFLKDFVARLRTVGIQPAPGERPLHLHMSIARFLKDDQYEQIWKYLQSVPAPRFDLSFDNLTIFVKENRDDRAWKVLKTFPLTGARK